MDRNANVGLQKPAPKADTSKKVEEKGAAAKKETEEKAKEEDNKESEFDIGSRAPKKEGEGDSNAKNEESGDVESKKEGDDKKGKQEGKSKGDSDAKGDASSDPQAETDPEKIEQKKLMGKVQAAKEEIRAAKPAGTPPTPKRDTLEAIKKVAADNVKEAKEAKEKQDKELAAAPKAEQADGVNTTLVSALAVDGTIRGSSKYYNSEAELWTENMPKHIQDYNGGLGATTYSGAKFDKPWGADIE